jgi:hypothetical protein
VTTVINLWAGSGCGKSTTAADVFARMKLAGLSVELVTEYVKQWAWRGVSIGPWDDVYIFAKQLRRESSLYGKVDYIVTDSPLGLGAVYERHYHATRCTLRDLCNATRKRKQEAGIVDVNCLLKRTKPFVQAGRYEDEAGARAVDRLVEEHLRMGANRPFHFVDGAADVLRAAGLPGAI